MREYKIRNQLNKYKMKRYESRNISRSRNRVEALSPCTAYSINGGRNPFYYLFSKFASQFGENSEEEK